MPSHVTPAVHPRADLRCAPNSMNWIARDLDDPEVIWTWTPYTDSWSQRVRYHNAIDHLEKAPAWKAFNTGWPGAQPAQRAPREQKPADELRSFTMQLKVTGALREKIIARANDAGKSVSTYLADLVADTVNGRTDGA